VQYLESAQEILIPVAAAWELAEMDTKEYYAEVPPRLYKRLHLFNFAVETDPASPRNPLNIVRRLHKPGDFVVLKLDVDNEKARQTLTPASH